MSDGQALQHTAEKAEDQGLTLGDVLGKSTRLDEGESSNEPFGNAPLIQEVFAPGNKGLGNALARADGDDGAKGDKKAGDAQAADKGDQEIVLSVKYGEDNIARELNENPKATVLKINGVPDGVEVKYWKHPDKGYFIWFKNGHYNDRVNRPVPHFYPDSLKFIEVNGRRHDVEREEYNVERIVGKQVIAWNDPQLDAKLKEGFARVEITGMPKGATLHHWVDEKGYFFFFKVDGKNGQPHHYTPNLRTLEVEGQTQDVEKHKILVAESYMAKKMGIYVGINDGFASIEKRDDVIGYMARMSNLGLDYLNVQEKILRENANNSTNPYFRIFLADVMVAKAVQPIIKQALAGGTIRLDNPDTIKQIDEAIKELKAAQNASNKGLEPGNKWPPRNVPMPMRPFQYDDPYVFFGGSLYQSQRREVALVWLKGLLQAGALPAIELPPVRKAR